MGIRSIFGESIDTRDPILRHEFLPVLFFSPIRARIVLLCPIATKS
jgi:hypothetical protein